MTEAIQIPKYRFIRDPGHGWLEVGFAALKTLGLNPQDFSRCSYRLHNITFYLEEDCDAPKFIRAWEAKFGAKPTTEQCVYLDPCFVRDLDSIC